MRAAPYLVSLLCILGVALGLWAWAAGPLAALPIYVMDDVYIHLALARQLAQTGLLGINPGEFAAGSSSPLYLGLLSVLHGWLGPWSAYAAAGLGGLVLAMVVGRALQPYGVDGWADQKKTAYQSMRPSPWLLAGAAVWICLTGPAHIQVLSGMEHIWHMAALAAVVLLAARCLQLKPEDPLPLGWGIALAASCLWMCAVRYEGLFAAAAVAGLLAVRGRWGWALAVGLAAGLPALLLGFYQLAHGAHFLPNTLLAKTNQPTLNRILVGHNLFRTENRLTSTLILLLLVALLEVAAGRTFWHRRVLEPALVLTAGLLHLALAQLGWLYRYEAYLVLAGQMVLVRSLLAHRHTITARISALRHRGQWPALALAAALMAHLLVEPLYDRALKSATYIKPSLQGVYRQQWRMGTTLARQLPGWGVAANDIGAIAYLRGTGYVLDVVGLASPAVLEHLLAHRQYGGVPSPPLPGPYLDSLARAKHVRVAVLYDKFTPKSGLPWYPVATWTDPDNYLFPSNTVHWYALNASDTTLLKRALIVESIQ